MNADPPPTLARGLAPVLEGMAALSFASVYLGAWMGVAVVELLGPSLAELLQMYGGNTEPRLPALPWPIGWTILTALLPVPLALRRRWTVATLATLPLLAVSAWQLRALYFAAANP